MEFLNAFFSQEAIWMNLKAMFWFKTFLKPCVKLASLIDGMFAHWQILSSLLHRSGKENYIYQHKSTCVTPIQSISVGGQAEKPHSLLKMCSNALYNIITFTQELCKISKLWY